MMHMQGTPENMQKNPQYGDVVEDIKKWLEERIKLRKWLESNVLILL